MGLVFWTALIPLIAALVILVVPKAAQGFYKAVGFLGSAVSLVLIVILWSQFQYQSTGFQALSTLHWFTLPNLWQGNDLSIGLTFAVDGLSLPLITLAAVVSLLATLVAKPQADRAKEFYFWFALDTAGILSVFTALDLFTFFVALELTLFATFFLIYLFGRGDHHRAALKFLLYRGLSTVVLLVALIGLAYGAAGAFAAGGLNHVPASAPTNNTVLTFSFTTLQNMMHQVNTSVFPSAVRTTVFVFLLLAVLVEEAFIPFHTWFPTASESADTPTNMLLGGVLTKTGAYILLRFGVGLLPGQIRHLGVLIAIVGTINILYAAFAAWAQKDWRRLIAFGSISHMGLVLLGIAALTSAGLQGAMFMIISSGLLTALLFFITGSIEERTQTVQMQSLGGLSKRMPMLSGFLLVAALGSLGLPLTSGFISEIQAFIGGFDVFPGIAFFAAIGLILSAVYLLYAIQKTTFGPEASGYVELADASPLEYIPLIVLTALVLLIGIYPAVLGNVFGLSVHALLGIGG